VLEQHSGELAVYHCNIHLQLSYDKALILEHAMSIISGVVDFVRRFKSVVCSEFVPRSSFIPHNFVRPREKGKGKKGGEEERRDWGKKNFNITSTSYIMLTNDYLTNVY